MAGTQSKASGSVAIGDELRAVFIGQLIRGKEQLYQSRLELGSCDDGLESYQWSDSEDESSPRYVSGGIKIENTDDECINITTVMYNTALIHMKIGEVDTAEKCFDLAMECFELVTEESKFENSNNAAYKALVFAGLFNNIGCMQYRDGNITGAKKSFGKALKIGKNTLRPSSGDYKSKMVEGYKHVGTIYYNIGSTNARLGLEDEVMRPLECSLGLQKVALGESHPDIVNIQHSIGLVLMGVGQWSGAMKAFMECLSTVRFVFGNDDHQVAKELFHLGKIHEMKGEYNEALHVYEETLRIERLTLGVIHPETIMTMYEIGQIYQNKGDMNEALNMYHDILSVAKASNNIEESSLVLVLHEMVRIYLEIGNIDAATKLYAEVASTIELNSADKALVDIVGLAQVKDLLVNPPAAAAA
eukprot:CAMPEP_0172478504 /NCGR_PEP_ID=MMETSP1066-20121228/2530_1 /TAXON_ID=671091 /ORGANISM="Coscinodiscus wailesii, Strain CCMP2513" /LENGTH=416 /DNA_ID=CAMNT_0013238149 /DNA_START=579 /DNA_END=1832 /DNA_ORIENTATION=+